jgi:hypothetical protein
LGAECPGLDSPVADGYTDGGSRPGGVAGSYGAPSWVPWVFVAVMSQKVQWGVTKFRESKGLEAHVITRARA